MLFISIKQALIKGFQCIDSSYLNCIVAFYCKEVGYRIGYSLNLNGSDTIDDYI